ncbi:MAG: Rid family hydrolase [Actinobacteria bacterium]|nr:Rid family hydrolase [Actinomycetota bacterium]
MVLTISREMKPVELAAPVAAYAHGVHVPAGSELIFTSGVVPTRRDGNVPTNIGEQANVVWQNILAILAEGSMTISDVVSVTTYVVNSDDLADHLKIVMAARDLAMAGHRAASTLVTVPALARPEWLIEISVVAARQPNS